MCLTAVLTEIKETKESCLSNRKRLQETHLKVPRKASRKFHKGVYYASEFPALFPCTFRCVFLFACSVTWVILGRFFYLKNFGGTQHSSSKLDSVFVCTKFPLFPTIYLLHEYLAALNIAQVNLALYSFARYFRENGRYCCSLYSSHVFCMWERPILPQIPQITQRNAAGLHYFADKRQLAHTNLLKQMPLITLRKTVTT